MIAQVAVYLLGIGLAANDAKAVESVLDDWHRAAASADEKQYFRHIADSGVFLGTDATERWTKPEFQAFAHPYFAKGKAWTFKATKRNISFTADNRTAWFDELLATEKMGVCRGSGVLTQVQGKWQIVQYNLSTPIPNAVMPRVLEIIAMQKKTQANP